MRGIQTPESFQLPVRLSQAERQFNSLSELHKRLVFEAQVEDKGPETLPAWYAHLASGERFRIKWIGTHGPFVRFTAPDDKTFVLLAPEAVTIEVEPIPEGSDTPRVKIGFQPPEEE
jgi:hypothetical protein